MSTETLYNSVSVVVGDSASDLEQFAAGELCGYIEKLFGVRVSPANSAAEQAEAVFLLGNAGSSTAIAEATSFPQVSDQGIVLRRTEYQGRPALIVGGGSSRATLWAVYELAERWGVRYLMSGDVLPRSARE